MSQTVKAEPERCPKCGSEMEIRDGTFAIPKYVEPSKPGHFPQTAATASLDFPSPVSIHFCPNCRFVELWA